MTINDKGVKFSNLSAFKAEIDKAYIANDKDQSLTDAQKVQALNNLMGKEYSPSSFSGFGKKVFAKNILTVNGVLKNVLTSSFFQDGNGNDLTNTVFVIQYDFTLGENISLPANSVLQFDGGSISGAYTLTGNNTSINAGMKKIFGMDVILAGTWDVNVGYPEWFGCYAEDSTIDATPVILKMINAGMHIEFGIGHWYLSECLINGDKVVIRGKSRGISRLTWFEPFAAGLRFIIKFGGNADFSSVTDSTYNTLKCSNFEISGISLWVPEDKKLVNADQSRTYQNFGAVCFDWSVRGYVDVQFVGYSPAIFMANSWEIHVEKIEVYGSYTEFDEYAIYFGKAFTNVQASNISQVKIENIYGESIFGHFIGCKEPNIGDLLINNIEVEVHAFLRPDYVDMSTANARAFIFGNIRTAPKYYMIELGGEQVTILNCDVQMHDNVISHNNENYILGLVKATKILNVRTLTNGSNPRSLVVGVSGSLGQLTIDNVVGSIYNDGDYPTSILTDVPQVDFSSHAYYEDSANIGNSNSGIYILNSNIIVNIDRIREYGPGLMFDADHYWEVSSLRTWNRNLLRTETDVDNVERKLLSVLSGSKILDRKMKFKDASKLKITYIGKNYWQSTDVIVLTYYKNGSVVETDGFVLPYNEKVMSHYIDLYNGDYDYCTFKINGMLSIEKVEVILKEDEATVLDKVIMFPSEISNDVKTIMSNYSDDDIYKLTALLYFFDKIGNIKSKLNHLILPIFASNINEATYDIITGTLFLPVGGTNYLVFNNTVKRVHMGSSADLSNWQHICYAMYDETDNFEGALTIVSGTDGYNSTLYGSRVGLNSASLGYFLPTTTNNTKIISAGVVKNNNDNCYMRLGDTLPSDKLTSFTTLYSGWDRRPPIFGNIVPTDDTAGVRILVSSDQQLTAAEARTLRDAVIALDNKYFA